METGKNLSSFLQSLLRGAGQVMFQNSAWCGLLFIAGIFWGACSAHQCAVAWGAVVGLVVSTLTGHILKLPRNDGEQGLWGFNGILVGCALPTFLGNTAWMWAALVLCAALTTWVRTGMNNVMRPWHVNSLTFPFVLCTWFFLLAARAMHSLPPAGMAEPSLPGAFAGLHGVTPGQVTVYWLKGISQVFLTDSAVTGALFLAGLAVSNWRAAVWAAAGSALATAAAMLFRGPAADISHGLYGYSPVLTAIALATVFYRPGLRSAVWALLGIAVTLFVQAGMNVLLSPVGLATLTAPFCIATWLFLLPLIRMDNTAAGPDHTDWDERRKPHLKRGNRAGNRR